MVWSSVRRMLTSTPAADSARSALRAARSTFAVRQGIVCELRTVTAIGEGECRFAGTGDGVWKLRIAYSRMQHAAQHVRERFFYLADVLEREVAFVELAVHHLFANEGLNHTLHAGRSWFLQASRRGFHRVGKHNDTRLAG